MDAEPSTALPNEWIAQLFRRFRMIYGNRLETMWTGTDPDDLAATWAFELRHYTGEDIKSALDAMHCDQFVEWPPTLFQFADLCRDAKQRRMQVTPLLGQDRLPIPEHIRKQLDAFKAKYTVP